jgi:hypothetical protein
MQGNKTDFKYETWSFYAWNLKDAYRQLNTKYRKFDISYEYALFTSKGHMLFSSTAFYRDFDYDLALATKGKKVDYIEDYTDEWSQYMLGLAVKFNWV